MAECIELARIRGTYFRSVVWQLLGARSSITPQQLGASGGAANKPEWLRKLAEDNKRLAAKASASAKRKADDAPRGLLPLGEQALRGGARTAELPRAAQDGTIGSRRGAAASFVTKAKPRGNGKPGGSQLIREGYDELGRRTKALKKTHARLEEDVVVSVDEARGIFGTPAGQRIPRGGGEITVPKDRHAAAKSGGLRIEHFFNRNG